MSYEDDPRHIDRVREDMERRRQQRAANPRPTLSGMANRLVRRMGEGLKENDARDMREAGFPETVVESWKATPL